MSKYTDPKFIPQTVVEEVEYYGRQMSETAKFKRMLFARSYIMCFNKTQAARDAGFGAPEVKGSKLSKEPYTAALIRMLMEEIEEEKIVTNREVLYGLKKEAMNEEDGSQMGRISAWSHLAKIKGMQQPDTQVNVNNGGGVMVVGEVKSVDDWEAEAAASQSNLKDSVRE
ncbi:terminase small subunit [Vibrio phage VpKK5]|uniref:terminase small subunit n=1 Tax=Vibrio phage VpKK5 TaxID=1538804 RepID=UPI0004F732C2|nr:terminase small subunit [Vibrio phage VpKK5]AIM40566.1 terminase small subunit [Vibrio phage VpKK5]